VSDDVRRYWDQQAATFDDEPDHGLRDPLVRSAWIELLRELMPTPPADVADLGCGTGTIAVLLAQDAHRVRGLDVSDRMITAAKAKAKAAGVHADLRQGDASSPPYAPASADAVLVRHVLWALPNPGDALRRWTRLLRPGGRLVLIEGHWTTGAGIAASDCQALVLQHRREALVKRLDDPALWGQAIEDERYALLSRD
jgi:ubiquinone/menaquinone biosynthesis C-methylase UbiE